MVESGKYYQHKEHTTTEAATQITELSRTKNVIQGNNPIDLHRTPLTSLSLNPQHHTPTINRLLRENPSVLLSPNPMKAHSELHAFR